jgi:hypothetical protein
MAAVCTLPQDWGGGGEVQIHVMQRQEGRSDTAISAAAQGALYGKN